MTTTSILTRLGVIAAALAAPAALLLGAGTAQAEGGRIDPIGAHAVSAPGGVDVHIDSINGAASSGWCTFTSRVQGNPWGKPLPATNVPFYLPAGGTARLWFPSYPTGSTWDIKVNCPDTGPQFTTLVW